MKRQRKIEQIRSFQNEGYGNEPDFDNANLVIREGKGIFINKTGNEIIKDLIRSFQNELKNEGTIDQKSLEKYFFDNCFDVLINNKVTDKDINESLDNFKFNVKDILKEEHMIIIPITGLVLKGELELQNFTILSKSKLLKEYKEYFYSNKMGKEEFKRLKDSGDSYAITKDFGNPKSLINKQIDLLESALNLIRLYIPLFWYHTYEVQISIVNQDYQTINSGYVITNNKLRYVTNSVTRRPHKFDIDKKRMNSCKYSQRKEMKNWNFEKLNSIIIKEHSNISNAIINSLHWIGLYTKEKKLNLKFLYLIFSLEGLLSNEKNNYSSITAAVSEKTAFLLTNHQEDRIKIFNFIKDLYKKRGGIVHGSEKFIGPSELTDLYVIIIQTFYHITDLVHNNEIKTKQELNEKLTEIKFN